MTDQPSDGEGNDIWQRLRRRKVGQWGIAYVAGAWGFLQGLAYVSTLLDWPGQLQKLAGLALLIGLPIALTLAWYHGDKGQQRVTRSELAILTLLFLVGGGLFWRYEHATRPPPGASAATTAVPAPAAATEAGPSIAVLPFENRSAKSDDVFFVDGIHDDILTQLSKISALKVISRTSVERFRDTKLPLHDVAGQLGVKSILEGGVQRGGDRVRINVQLIDAATDTHLWAETYDRELTAENIFAIQTELAAAIAGALKAALTPAEKASVKAVPTRNLEAWEAYQLGRQRLAKRNGEAFAEAERYFRRAIALDPKFALAYAGLADTLVLRLAVADAPPAESLQQAQAALTKALELDPALPEAWISSGILALQRQDVAGSLAKLSRAIELDPNNAMALKFYGSSLLDARRPAEARRNLEKAAELDPLSAIVQINLADAFQAEGDFAAADRCYRRALEIDPTFSPAYLWLGFTAAYAQDRFSDALALVRKAVELDADSVIASVLQAQVEFDLGDDTAFVTAARDAGRRWPDDFRVQVMLAVADLYQGRHGSAAQRAERSLSSWPRNQQSLSLLRDLDLRAGQGAGAVERYRKSYPELFNHKGPAVDGQNAGAAIDLASLLQSRGDREEAQALLDAAESIVRPLPRLGPAGYGIADVQIHAIRGEKGQALAALREAEHAGWRGPAWRYYRDFDSTLASIRNEPEFKAVFANIERDMARQRAELAARPKDAPLNLGSVN